MAKNRKQWPGGYVHENGSYYLERWTPVRVHCSTKCKTLKGAMAELERYERNPAAYVPGGSRSGAQFSVIMTAYITASEKKNTKKHADNQEAALARIGEYFMERGITRLEQIDGRLVEEYVDSRGSKLSAAMHELAYLKAMLSWASDPRWRDRPIESNPLRDVHVSYPKRKSKKRTFTVEEWRAVRAKLLPRWQDVGDALFATGVRYSSLARLKPSNVEFRDDGAFVFFGDEYDANKDGDGHTRRVTREAGLACLRVAQSRIPKVADQLDERLRSASVRAGLPEGRHFTAHMFRHTFAKLAEDQGLSIYEISGLLGHASVRTTQVYMEDMSPEKQWTGPTH